MSDESSSGVLPDFVSEASLESGLRLADDNLGHDKFANQVLEKAAMLHPGSVVAIQGPWGRGKTDVLARVALTVLKGEGRSKGFLRAVSWINPWQYGTTDLLTPLVISLLRKISPKRRSTSKSLWKAAETLLKAGTNFGLKLTPQAVPGGGLLDITAGIAESVFKGLLEAKAVENEPELDPDPVQAMGQRFRELVGELISDEQELANPRMLICVDDLDRCLPDRQVALLEAVRFLTSAGARATFLVALDPALARQAVIAHYQTSAFDPDRYLDKMFQLRLTLPAVAPADLVSLIRGQLKRRVGDAKDQRMLGHVIEKMLTKDRLAELEEVAPEILRVPGLRNPRIVSRIFERLCLLARSGTSSGDLGLESKRDLKTLLLWLVLIERWPQVREALQDAGDKFAEMFYEIRNRFAPNPGPSARGVIAAVERLPSSDESPELQEILGGLSERAEIGDDLYRFDKAMVNAGL